MHRWKMPLVVTSWLLLAGALVGCKREEPPEIQPPPPAPKGAVLLFPAESRVADPEVNAFVTRAMEACSSDDYESCRLLWSATTEPISREQFERGWRAVEEIRILGVRALPTPEGDTVYAIHAYVALDAANLPRDREPSRRVVLVGVQELGEWRIARAPKRVREWMVAQVEAKAPVAPQDDPAKEPGD